MTSRPRLARHDKSELGADVDALGLPSGPGDRSWFCLARDPAAELLGVDPHAGLSEEEAARRRDVCGANELAARHREGPLERFVEELREPMILLLVGTGLLYSVWGELPDAITIFAVISLLITSEVINEWRAERAIDALADLSQPTANVRRARSAVRLPARDLVPGDVVLVEAGERVPADLRLFESWGLVADESALTGESVPVAKDAAARLTSHAVLAERPTMLHAGTAVVAGRAVGLAVATGETTEVGRIAALAATAKPPRTLLQRSMNELSRSLVGVALVLSAVVPLLGVALGGQSADAAVLTGLSLAFATIPEEMPILLTMVLAVGGYRLARRRAIVRRLSAVESLGVVTVVVTDKTGTLTQNRLEVLDAVTCLDRDAFLLRAAASVHGDPALPLTDPVDVALCGAGPGPVADPVVGEYTFDSSRRRSSLVRRTGTGYVVAVKGAPEAVFEVCSHRLTGDGPEGLDDRGRADLLAAAATLADRGSRVLAVADAARAAAPVNVEDAERDLCLVGLVAFADRPRPEAAGAVATCRQAGIRVVMVTGDHPATAAAIAAQVGIDGRAVCTGSEIDGLGDGDLLDALRTRSVFARVAPEHKHRIVQVLQRAGEVVAVTGDGVNDAPALAAADIGVAMGERGTDVARDAADVVLADDNFATLEAGIEEGRLLGANLRKAVRFYLAAKVALLSTVLVVALAGLPQPFAPIQIIVMELFMDLAASAAFVAEHAEQDLMRQPPVDPRGRFLDRPLVRSIFAAGLTLFVGVCGAYLAARAIGHTAEAGTVAFVTWQLGHVALAFHLRSERDPLTRMGVTTNRVMVAWAAAVAAFVTIALSVPALRDVFRTTTLSASSWALVALGAFAATAWLEIAKHLHRRSRRHRRRRR